MLEVVPYSPHFIDYLLRWVLPSIQIIVCRVLAKSDGRRKQVPVNRCKSAKYIFLTLELVSHGFRTS